MPDQRTVWFSLPGAAVRLLREGSPGEEILREVRYADARPVGRGRSYFFSVRREVAEQMHDYLASVAGVVGDMSGAEREGGSEHRVAADAARRIEEALDA